MASATNITLNTTYVLNKLEYKLAVVKKEYAQYEKDLEKFEATREARELKLKKLILKSLTVDNISFSSTSKYNHTLSASYDYRIFAAINHEDGVSSFLLEDMPEFLAPQCEFTERIIKELEQMVEVLKACATATFNSKILGSVQNYL
jgi:formiminotetrahydrofolate cyclodeaminase